MKPAERAFIINLFREGRTIAQVQAVAPRVPVATLEKLRGEVWRG